MKKMQKTAKTKALGITALAIFGLAAILAIAGLSNTIGKLDDQVISHTPDAILASAGVDEAETISLPVAYYDQKSDPCINIYDTTKSSELKKRQFEWSSCDYQLKELEQGLVEYYLNDKYLPVATGDGQLTANRGLTDLTRWFSSVDGKSQSYTGTIALEYSSDGAVFSYQNDNFYPLDEAKFSAGDEVNRDGHNHLFTMNLALPFTVLRSGNEIVDVTADDDTFVYVGSALALDLGGVHDTMSGQIIIHDDGEVYASVGDEEPAYTGITLADTPESIIRIFHADRDSSSSVLGLKFSGISLNVISSELADSGEGIQVAYDPTDPSYVAPLGETSVFRPDNTRGYIIMATIFGLVIMALSLLIAIFARHLLKQRSE